MTAFLTAAYFLRYVLAFLAALTTLAIGLPVLATRLSERRMARWNDRLDVP